MDQGSFGNATMNNTLLQTGQLEYTIALAQRFNAEVPDTVTFAFDSATLTPEAMEILRKQANWIRQFPEVRFKSSAIPTLSAAKATTTTSPAAARVRWSTTVHLGNFQIPARGGGQLRQDAAIIQTDQPNSATAGTVTEVSGFVKNHPLVLNGKYAEVIWRSYTGGWPNGPTPATPWSLPKPTRAKAADRGLHTRQDSKGRAQRPASSFPNPQEPQIDAVLAPISPISPGTLHANGNGSPGQNALGSGVRGTERFWPQFRGTSGSCGTALKGREAK